MKKKIKILIAEDEALIAHWLKMELEIMGYDVCSLVSSGEETISETLRLQPDFILLDLYLIGNVNGVEAANKIHETSPKNIPIIVITGYDDSKIDAELKSVKPIARLQKPINVEEIKKIIEAYN